MTYKRIRPCVNLPKSLPNVSIISYLCQQMRKAALSIAATAVLLMGTLALKAENYWQRAVVNYSRQQYRSGNQNWQVSQSWQGWMYFANNKGLLEFDGSNWQTYALPGNPKVRAVRAEGDTIYVGALGQFGRFVRNQKGRLVYERLSDHLEKAGQLNVWHIHRIGDFKHRQHPADVERALSKPHPQGKDALYLYPHEPAIKRNCPIAEHINKGRRNQPLPHPPETGTRHKRQPHGIPATPIDQPPSVSKSHPAEGIGEEQILHGINERFVAMPHVQIDHAVFFVGSDNGEVAVGDDILDAEGIVLRRDTDEHLYVLIGTG